jgi:DNA-binding NarL/FixJ family response regulator
MGKIQVLLADDHESILAKLRLILSNDFDVVGAVSNGYEAITEVQRLDPDVLVIDISMPGVDGLQAASRLHSQRVRTKIVFLTVHEDEDFVNAAFSAGASAYVTKSQVTTDLIPAIEAAMRGGRFVSSSSQ